MSSFSSFAIINYTKRFTTLGCITSYVCLFTGARAGVKGQEIAVIKAKLEAKFLARGVAGVIALLTGKEGWPEPS